MLPAYQSRGAVDLPLGTDHFVAVPAPNASPCATGRSGIFVTGTAMGPMDIVDSIVSAGAVAAAVSAYIRERQDGRTAPHDQQEALRG
jgi:heterodisulfide reductase subunit A